MNIFISKKKAIKISIKIIYAVIFVWLILSIFRTGYNLSKLITNRSSLSIDSETKRLSYFGVNQLLVERIEKTRQIKRVLLLNQEGTISYFYLRYKLYPIQFYTKKNNLKFDAVIVLNRGGGVGRLVSQYKQQYPTVEDISYNNKIEAYLLLK